MPLPAGWEALTPKPNGRFYCPACSAEHRYVEDCPDLDAQAHFIQLKMPSRSSREVSK